MKFHDQAVVVSLLVFSAALAADDIALPPAARIKVDFRRDIEPVFEKRCFVCHGPQQQMSGLRLDQKEAALKGGSSGRVIEPGKLPSLALLPSRVRATVESLARVELDISLRRARREAEAAALRLRQAGWRARAVVRIGTPLPELLRTVREEKARLLALGARGAGGVSRLLLGSVAHGALKQSPVAVLIVP